MAMTKLQVRTAIQQMSDDPNAANWTAANLDILTGMVYDELWGEIINTNPYFVTQLDTLTSLTVPGFFDVRLVADGGNLSKRFHRLQDIVRGGRSYTKLDQRDILVEDNAAIVTGYNFTYSFYGDQIWLFPLETTGDVEVRYSFKPAAYTSLADGTSISWPDGYEGALTFEVAGRSMLRGERESAGQILSIASRTQENMMTMVRKRSHFMSVPWANQSASTFGGT